MQLTSCFVALTIVATLSNAAPAEAQDTLLRWGVEASTGGTGSLLRFRNPTSAWVLNAAFFYDRIDEPDPPSPLARGDLQLISAEARFGMRFYRRVQEKTRPFTTVSALLGYQGIGSGGGTRPGVALELGASHFFTRHVSLGGSVDLRGYYWRQREQSGLPPGSIVTRRLSIGSGGVRLHGGVYF